MDLAVLSGVDKLQDPSLDHLLAAPSFEYDPLPLDGHHVRLLHLLPGSPEDPICCTLSLIDIDHLQEPYTAVSYTWGPENPRALIQLNGLQFVVRQNLLELLYALRSPHHVVSLWVDAICIDQSSLRERNHQVGRMGDIYSKAEWVDAWLGQTYNMCSTLPLTYCRTVAERYRDSNERVPADVVARLEQSVIIVCSFPYWRRAWIIQELVLAQDMMFYLGSESISWEDLVFAVSLVDKSIAPVIRAIDAMRGRDKRQRSFEELFQTFGHMQCTFDHDRFYSLYGMVGKPSTRSMGYLRPNYGLCITEVFMQQLLRWEYASTVRSPINFVSSFQKHLFTLPDYRDPCQCHTMSNIVIRLPFRGIVRLTEGLSSKERQTFFVDDDVPHNRRRHSQAAHCVLNEGDLAFTLDSDVDLIVRHAEEPDDFGLSNLDNMNVVGFTSARSGSFSIQDFEIHNLWDKLRGEMRVKLDTQSVSILMETTLGSLMRLVWLISHSTHFSWAWYR